MCLTNIYISQNFKDGMHVFDNIILHALMYILN